MLVDAVVVDVAANIPAGTMNVRLMASKASAALKARRGVRLRISVLPCGMGRCETRWPADVKSGLRRVPAGRGDGPGQETTRVD